jgi:hypothetical protein
MSYVVQITTITETINITANVLSADWSRALGESSATLDLECKNLFDTYCMDTITLSVDGVLCFSGIIKNQSDSYDQTMKLTSLNCVDQTDKLQRIIVTEAFENQTAREIIIAIRNKYAPWLGVTKVEEVSGQIEQIAFNYETFSSILEKLAEITGAYWNVDAYDRLSFFLELDGYATIDYTPERIVQNSFGLESTAMDLCNRIWIIGAKQASPNVIEQNFTGDGLNQFYSIAYDPNYPEVFENGVSKTIELDDGDEASSDYVYNKKQKVLKRVTGNLPPFTTLKLRYNPTVQVIDYFEDSNSVATYGLYEKAVVDQKITDKLAARSRARAELKRVRNIIRKANFNSRSWQVSVGEVTRVIMPKFNVNSYWRIMQIDVNFSPEDIMASFNIEEVDN